MSGMIENQVVSDIKNKNIQNKTYIFFMLSKDFVYMH